jgi:sulfopyruvate decarboxylase subunit beta
MKPEEEATNMLANAGVDLVATLPCEKVRGLLDLATRRFAHVPLTREEEGVGICAGAYLAGKRPAMIIQTSGVGNIVNALASLTRYYQLALPILVSWRGVYKEAIDAQVPMGKYTPRIAQSLDIDCTKIHSREELHLLGDALNEAYRKEVPHFILLSPRIWSSYGEEKLPRRKLRKPRGLRGRSITPLLTRYQVLEAAASYLKGKVVVCNLGFPCKELYQIMDQPSNFYMLGSMGMATPIALGIAMNTEKGVVAVDGDGSLLMNPGILATVAEHSPGNLTILAIDNAAYGSTGNQPTATADVVDLEMLARAFGLKRTYKVAGKEEISEILSGLGRGPNFVHIVAKAGNAQVPNIPFSSIEIKRRVMEYLRE